MPLKLPPFELERWYAQYEFNVKHNISASCAATTGTADLLKLAGPEAREEYCRLNLDYTQNPGDPALRRGLSGLYPGLGPEDIQVTTGASEAILLVMAALLHSGDTVVVEDPIYQSLHEVARACGARIKRWTLEEADGFRPDLDRLAALIDSETRLVIINHPHSPTGAMITAAEQRELIHLIEARGLTLVSDEVYAGIFYDPADALAPAASLSPRAVSIGDVTKPYGLGGLRVGWVASQDQRLLDRCSALRDYTTMCNSAPGEFLARIAVGHREEILKEKIGTARGNISMFADMVARHMGMISWTPPRGGFTAFPRYHLDLDSPTFCERLVSQKGVLLLPGKVFGREGHFRIGFGKKNDDFRAGLELLDQFFTELAVF